MSTEHASMEELKALMSYMISHNASHGKELSELAEQLCENQAAYAQVVAAIADFDAGNQKLQAALCMLLAE